jgi:hypothetical protein
MRENGFYWIKLSNDDWQIAKWRNAEANEIDDDDDEPYITPARWTLCGWEVFMDDDDIEMIDERRIEHEVLTYTRKI